METERALAGEMIHRVKNSIAMAGALSRMTVAESVDLPACERRFNRRLLALAGVDTLVLASGSSPVPMRALLERGLSLLATPCLKRIGVAAADVAVPCAVGQMLALAVNELATNAVKHGALADPDGTVALNVERIADGPDGRTRFTWVETRGGDTAPDAVPEFAPGPAIAGGGAGHTLLTRLLSASGCPDIALTLDAGAALWPDLSAGG